MHAYMQSSVAMHYYTCGLTSTKGNTGSYLTETVSTYITRDGGLTWEQVNDLLCHILICQIQQSCFSYKTDPSICELGQ